jgi:tetratricopeptide (TPR) repeat protein
MPVRAQYATNMRAVLAVSTHDYDAATKLLERSIEMARANGDVAEQAKSLGNLAAVHNFRGFLAQSAKEYEALLPLLDPRAQPYPYAALLGNYGFTSDRARRFRSRAGIAHRGTQALHGDRRGSRTRRRAGGARRALSAHGDADRAIQTLRAAIVEHERLGDNGRLPGTLRAAANAASMLGQHDTAIEYLRKSVRFDADRHSVARTHVRIAAELRIAGKLADAEAELLEPQESANAQVLAEALEERALLRLAQDLPDTAIEDLRAADRQYAQLGLEFNRIDTNTALSQALLGKRDVTGAIAAANEAIAIVTRIRVKSANPEWRARFLSARYAPYEALIAADLASSDVGAVWRTFRTAEEVRARSLGDELALSASGAIRPADPQEEELRARLTSQQLLLEGRIQRQDPEEGTLALRHSIEETRAQLDAIRIRQGGVAARQTSLPGVARAGTAPVAAGYGGARLLRRRPWRARLVADPQRVASCRSACPRPAATGHRRCGRCARRPHSEPRLGFDVVRTSARRHSPKTACWCWPTDPSTTCRSLLCPCLAPEETAHRSIRVGLCAVAGAGAGNSQPDKSRNTRVAVVSDPVYAADDRRLSVGKTSDSGTLRSAPPPSPNNLTRLPYSALEASAVTKAFGSDGTIQLSGFEATATRVLQLPSNELAVLHFATHAEARRDSPEQSALYLTEYTPDGAWLPSSRLTTNDIARSGLRADVVVLSGCATGDGSALRGEGVLGLTYGFLANGSHSVVAALWPIEDASTARLMKEFYGAYRQSGRAADALRIAQLRTRGSAATNVWSSFVVRANDFRDARCD